MKSLSCGRGDKHQDEINAFQRGVRRHIANEGGCMGQLQRGNLGRRKKQSVSDRGFQVLNVPNTKPK